MRTETTTREIYTFDELSPGAQQKAIEARQQSNSEYYEPYCVYEDAATIAELFGLDIRQTRKTSKDGSKHWYDATIYYSGFCSQGDGASFEGTYSYKPGALKAVKAYASQDTKLHRIVKDLQDVQRVNFYRLTARCKHSGHYYHSGYMSVDVENTEGLDVSEDAEEAVKEALRDFANWIYSRLEDEYYCQTSEEYAREDLQQNNYEFDAEGDMI